MQNVLKMGKLWKFIFKYLNHLFLNGFFLTVVDPMRKAAVSVSDVTVMDTPACFIVSAIRRGMGRSCCSGGNFSRL